MGGHVRSASVIFGSLYHGTVAAKDKNKRETLAVKIRTARVVVENLKVLKTDAAGG